MRETPPPTLARLVVGSVAVAFAAGTLAPRASAQGTARAIGIDTTNFDRSLLVFGEQANIPRLLSGGVLMALAVWIAERRT